VFTSEADFEQDEQHPGVWFPPPYRLPFNASSPALSSSIVASLGNARLWGFTVTSTNVAAQFIMLFDESGVPANGKIPRLTFNVAAANFVTADFGDAGRWHDRGIILCNSTTQGTLTLGAADCIFDVQYV
jgi:hypothetical protein